MKLRFGAYHSTEGPGLAYAIPYVDEIIARADAAAVEAGVWFRHRAIDERISRAIPQPEDTETMITGDLNTALVPWVVQYRIADPKQYLFGAREPEKTLRDLSESVMREVIGDRTVDEVLTIGRHDIETAALGRLAKLWSEYGLGLQIQQVQLATVRPPRGGAGRLQRSEPGAAGKTDRDQPGVGGLQRRGAQRPRPGQGARETSGGLRVSPDQQGKGRHREILSSPG